MSRPHTAPCDLGTQLSQVQQEKIAQLMRDSFSNTITPISPSSLSSAPRPSQVILDISICALHLLCHIIFLVLRELDLSLCRCRVKKVANSEGTPGVMCCPFLVEMRKPRLRLVNQEESFFPATHPVLSPVAQAASPAPCWGTRPALTCGVSGEAIKRYTGQAGL